MSRSDPYASQYAAGTSHQRQRSQPYADPYYSQPQQGYNTDSQRDDYDPYIPNETPPQEPYHDSDRPQQNEYRGGYSLENTQPMPEYNNYPPPQRTLSKKKSPYVSVTPVRKEESGFEQGEFTPGGATRKNRSARALKEYRYDHQGTLWTKGGRGRCCGRVLCCTLMTTVFLILSVVLSLALWVRPPAVVVGEVQTMQVDGTTIQQMADGIKVNLGVDISVKNPNYFSVDFKKIQANIVYPINNFPIGQGLATDVIFKSNSETNFTFPFTLSYNNTADTGSAVISDIAVKCGIGGTKQNLVVNYKISLGIRFLFITISPVIANQFNFACPLSASDISKFLGGSG
jgi:LEA14-like dessication related protein